MDAEQRYCEGCLRTLGEITRWGEMTEVERAAVVAQLPTRCAALPSNIAEFPASPLA